MSRMQLLKQFISERLSAAAEEIFTAVHRTTIEEEEEEAAQPKEQPPTWAKTRNPPQVLVCAHKQKHSGEEWSPESCSTVGFKDHGLLVPELSEIKQEQQEPWINPERQQTDVGNSEGTSLKLTPTCRKSGINSDVSEMQTRDTGSENRKPSSSVDHRKVEGNSLSKIECLIREFGVLVGEAAAPGRAVIGLDRAKFRSILHNVFGMTHGMIMDRVFRTFDKDNDSFVSIKEWIEGLTDHDHDGRLSFADFEKSVREENLLLEAFGTCLPDTTSIELFEHRYSSRGLYSSTTPYKAHSWISSVITPMAGTPWTITYRDSKLMNQALELSWGHGSSLFLSWTLNRTSSSFDSHRVELCRQLGEKLGLKDGEQGFLRPCHQVSSVHQVFVEPLSSDDWEILELHSASLEQQLLDQIRVVFQDAVFPVWVDSHTAIYIRIASLSPSVPYGRLEQFTELVVSPKTRAGISDLSGSPMRSSKTQHLHRQQNPDLSSSSLENTACVPHNHQWGGIADLGSLLRYIIKGNYEPVKELPPVPGIPALFTDSVYRVSGVPPDSLCTINHVANGVIHLFPWRRGLNAELIGGQSSVTYGLLSKVPSPKESRNKVKQAMDKKKNTGGIKSAASVDGGEEKKEEEAVVVRLPQEGDEEIQTAFLGWLHTQSHEPLACLTPRSGTVLLHGTDAKLEFALTVLKPEPANDPPDQLFLLAHSLIHKEDIQVDRESVTMPPLKAVAETPNPELPSLSILGGIDKLSKTGFEFISHSLLGSPLSRELCKTGQGLQGGALLITGAKGSGKSTLSRALCRKAREDLDAHVEVVDCRNCKAEWKQPSVVLLDDLDHVTGAPTSPEHEQGPEALLHQHIAQSLKDVVDEVVVHASLVCLIITARALKGFTPPSLWGIDLQTPSATGLEKVGGLREVRQQLMDTILLPAKYPILFSNLPIRHRSGILLYGAPGTGKTLLAQAVAKESGMNFISIKGPELLSKYIGASEQGVRDVFQRAQAAKPCILFFDEFDSLAPRRGHDSTGVTDRVVNQLLTQLDGVEGLQATSRPDLIDPALLRPGRLDKSLYCPPPDLESRVEILKALCTGVPLAANVDLEQLAAATEQFTGADLKALLYNAQLEAVHNSVGSSTPHDLTSGSDSDMSLSSMIFPNNSSGSDDSVGEGDPAMSLDQSMVLLEPDEFQAEEERHRSNNSQCVSGPNSVTQDCTGASVRDPGGSLPPVYMSSIQSGYEELNSEQLERLQQDISNIKNNYRRANEECVRVHSASSQQGLLLCQVHVNSALGATRPSLSKSDWNRYKKLYESFAGSRGGQSAPSVTFTPGQHSLACNKSKMTAGASAEKNKKKKEKEKKRKRMFGNIRHRKRMHINSSGISKGEAKDLMPFNSRH
ncbi:hypothetical protein INR49_023556 [Caranx melampygus]|nr:hypothetical protein INR49_023556 [Caranx melampygus]